MASASHVAMKQARQLDEVLAALARLEAETAAIRAELEQIKERQPPTPKQAKGK